VTPEPPNKPVLMKVRLETSMTSYSFNFGYESGGGTNAGNAAMWGVN